MATFKACVQKQRKDGLYQVYIRVTHSKKSMYMKTDKFVNSKGLDAETGNIKDVFVVKYCANKIADYVERLNKVDIVHWTVYDIIEFLNKADEDVCFSDYARKYKFEMAKSGQVRNSRNYEYSYNHLERYAGTNKLMFSRFTTQFINGWIKTLSTTSRAKEMYPICIRQIFKAAMQEYNDYDKGIIRIRTNPWGNIKIPSADVPEKRAISPENVRNFFSAPIPDTRMKCPVPELGRDVAMMVLCLCGINTVDLYHLKKADCSDGIIRYRRAKTKKFRADGAYMELRIPDILRPIFAKYHSDDDYMFNFHKRYVDSDSFGANVNGGIRAICKSMGMEREKYYCVYSFRHTWGTVAQNNCGASLEEIAFAMNHASAHKVTKGYILQDYEPASVLNQKVIDFLFFSAPEERKVEVEDNSMDIRLSPKYQVQGEAFFRGHKVGYLCDIGFSNKEEVIAALVDQLPEDIPDRCMVQFRIENMDKSQVAVYERMKGKGF